jgi:hypothetical protein
VHASEELRLPSIWLILLLLLLLLPLLLLKALFCGGASRFCTLFLFDGLHDRVSTGGGGGG